MHLSSVVLPQPDGPTTQTNSPSSTVKETSPIACVAVVAACRRSCRGRLISSMRVAPYCGGRRAPAAVPGEHAPLGEHEERR